MSTSFAATSSLPSGSIGRLVPIRMTLQLRLTLWYTALLALTLLLFSVAVYYALTTSLYTKVEDDARIQAPVIAGIIQSQLNASSSVSTLVPNSAPGDFPFIFQLIEVPPATVLVGIGDIQFFDIQTGEIYKSSDILFRRSVPVQDDVLRSLQSRNDHYERRAMYEGSPISIYSYPLITSKGILGVQIIQKIAPIDHALGQTLRLLMFGTFASLIFAAVVGAILARRTLKPLQTISQTASSITLSDDLGRRLSIGDQASEVGQLAAAFNAMLDRIQRLFRSQERLIADVSHELRTPLTTIQGNVELLHRVIAQSESVSHTSGQESAHPKDELKEILTEVESESNRMGRMISDLLLLAQADSGKLELQKTLVEMDTLLLDIYRQTRRIVERTKGVNALTVRIGSEDQALVLGDRERLRQLLLNLAENAVKYTPAGGTVTLGLRNENGWVQLYIRDNGIGIDNENQAQIFERFYRTDKARSRDLGGSGLGLSISQWIAHAHGGRITVKSQLHEGSEFTVWLPAIDRGAT